MRARTASNPLTHVRLPKSHTPSVCKPRLILPPLSSLSFDEVRIGLGDPNDSSVYRSFFLVQRSDRQHIMFKFFIARYLHNHMSNQRYHFANRNNSGSVALKVPSNACVTEL